MGEESLRGVRSWPGRRGGREALIDAVVELSGELGYRELTLRAVTDRAGSSNRAFHREFKNLEDAFGEGCERVLDQLCTELLAAGRGGADWQSGFRLALRALLAWVAAEPGAARVALSECRSAGDRAWAAHEGAIERLARAIDNSLGTGRERALPSLATRYLIGGIEFTLANQIRNGAANEVPRLEPTLIYMAMALYFGHDAASIEVVDR